MSSEELHSGLPPDQIAPSESQFRERPVEPFPESLLPVMNPSGVRYQVLAFLAAMTFILYLDRVCIGQAAEFIEIDLGLSETEMGFVHAAFTIAYGLFEIVTGQLGDRYGSRGVLMRIVLWWSFFTALTGAVFGFWMLLLVRFWFGAGEAGALPNVARVLRHWFPESARGAAQGIVTTAMMIGGAAANPTSEYLIKFVGWRMTFAIFGLIGAVWAFAFWWWYRDEPAAHPGVNSAELRLITAGRTTHDLAAEHPPIPWRLVLRSANVWLIGGLMSLVSAVFYMLISWYPKYLQSARAASGEQSSWLTSMVLAAGAVGCVLGGRLTDWLVKRTGNQWGSRCGLGVVVSALSGVCILASVHSDSTVLSACFVALALFCLDLQIPAWWATVTQISGRHVGAMFGLMNSMGVVGAAASQIFVGVLVDFLKKQGYSGRDQWDPGFYVYAVVMLMASVLWIFVRPEKSIVEPVN